MKLTKCDTLKLYFDKLGNEINEKDLVLVNDVKEIYVEGIPYGRNSNWIEPPRPEIGSYVTKSRDIIKFSDYTDDNRNELAGIYIGDHPDTGLMLLIPASTNFTYPTTQVNRVWCNDSTLSDSIYNNINPNDATTSSSIAHTKFNGKSQTEKILAAAISSDKGKSYFPASNWCSIFSPGFHDKEWYVPSMGELSLLNKNYSKIIPSITRLWSNITTVGAWIWSSTQYDKSKVWSMTVHTGISTSLTLTYGPVYVIPFLQIR